MEIKQYDVLLLTDGYSDNEKLYNVRTSATSKEQAIKQVLDFEHAPERAVVHCTEV